MKTFIALLLTLAVVFAEEEAKTDDKRSIILGDYYYPSVRTYPAYYNPYVRYIFKRDGEKQISKRETTEESNKEKRDLYLRSYYGYPSSLVYYDDYVSYLYKRDADKQIAKREVTAQDTKEKRDLYFRTYYPHTSRLFYDDYYTYLYKRDAEKQTA